jgi:hypothetical protein
VIGLLYYGRSTAMDDLDPDERARVMALDRVCDLVRLRTGRDAV